MQSEGPWKLVQQSSAGSSALLGQEGQQVQGKAERSGTRQAIPRATSKRRWAPALAARGAGCGLPAAARAGSSSPPAPSPPPPPHYRSSAGSRHSLAGAGAERAGQWGLLPASSGRLPSSRTVRRREAPRLGRPRAPASAALQGTAGLSAPAARPRGASGS